MYLASAAASDKLSFTAGCVPSLLTGNLVPPAVSQLSIRDESSKRLTFAAFFSFIAPASTAGRCWDAA
jgi:hypothetical protein